MTSPYHSDTSSQRAFTPYVIVDILSDHVNEVRTVAPYSSVPDGLVSGSYDHTLRVWTKNDQGKYIVKSILVGHSDYVMTCVERNGIIYSSGNDGGIIAWGEDGTPLLTVNRAHSLTISNLQIRDGMLVCGSWDQSASVWDISEGLIKDSPVCVLRGHTKEIDAVCIRPDGSVLTGSRDNSIRLWDHSGKLIHSQENAHNGSVRSLCLVPNVGFVSVGSDGLLRLWNNQCTALGNWLAHNNLVFHVSYVYEGQGNSNQPPLLLTSSEDQSLKIWECDGSLKQTIEFPSCVWQSAVLQNGDIAVACGDSNIYILSTDSSRSISEEQKQAIENQVRALKEKKKGIDTSKLEDVSVLKTLKGSRNGEHKIVNENGSPIVYIWNGNEWEKLGSVVDDPNMQGKEMNSDDGKMYDRVWKVEVSDGVQLSLGYNFGDDPVEVAILFTQQHGLPSYFVNEIVDFIKKRTGQEYIPDMSSGRSYNPYDDSTPSKPKSLLDQEKEKDHFPIKNAEVVSAIPNLGAVISKIKAFNSELAQSHHQFALTDSEWDVFEKESQLLSSSPESINFSSTYYNIIEKLLLWPVEKKFPPLDIIRSVMLIPSSEIYFSKRFQEGGKNLAEGIIGECLGDASNFALQLMGLRTLVNMCKWKQLHPQIISSLPSLSRMTKSLLNTSKDPVRVTIGRLLLNLSWVAHAQSFDTKTQVLELFVSLAGIYYACTNAQIKEEFSYDFLRGVGTLCLISVLKAETEICRQSSLYLSELVLSCQSTSSIKVQATAFQLLQVFQSYEQ